MENGIRYGLLLLAGLTLALALVWYVDLVVREIRGDRQVVIEPLAVIDGEGKANQEVGKALAQMLQARLQALVHELRDAQAAFTTDATAIAVPQGSPTAPVGDVRLWTQAVTLQTGLLQPVDLKLSVAGVDVGGMLPWLQRWMSSPKTLHLTVYLRGTEAQVFGSLAPLRIKDDGLRLSVKGEGGSPPALDAIVDSLAHEIVHRYLAQDTTNRLEVLDASEFQTLADILVTVAKANRMSIRGRPAQAEFTALVPSITVLADKVPDWPELGYLAGRIADSAKDPATAGQYYKSVRPALEREHQATLVAWIDGRMRELAPKPEEAKAADPGSETLPRSVDYSGKITTIRDGGQEGSVVGLALATALEFQITKTEHVQRKISARYIYYAARKAGRLDVTQDTGAQIKDGISVLRKEGAIPEEAWPYRAGHFADPPPPEVGKAERFRIADVHALSTVDEVRRALYQNGPVTAGVSLFQGAMTEAVTKTGQVPLPAKGDQIVGGHAVVIVGYDDEKQQFKFVNSWGKEWGSEGFGFLPYEYLRKYMGDAWTFKLST
jgi:hypothetical protein